MGRKIALSLASLACCAGLCGFAGGGQKAMDGPSPQKENPSPATAAPIATVQAVPQGALSFHAGVGSLFESSCIGCHNAKMMVGDLNLESLLPMSDDTAKDQCDLLQSVLMRVENGSMPPRKMPRPPTESISAATKWIRRTCTEVPSDPAKSAITAAATPLIPLSQQTAAGELHDNEALEVGDVFEISIKPMISNSCASCHNEKSLAGDLDLTRFLKMSGTEALKERDLWETVARRVEAQQMPPVGKPHLDAHQIAGVAHWIQQQYAHMDEEAAPDPGRVTVRRLNRHEYNNTIRDLLGINLNASADFPPDPYAYGFDNVGEALSFSPALSEMYLKAAQRVARAAVPLGPPLQAISTKYDSATLGQRNRLQVQVIHEFPVDASYNLRMSWDQQMPKGTIVTGHIIVDGREVFSQRFAYVFSQERALTAVRIPVVQGEHKVEMWMELAPASQQPRPFRGSLPYPISLEVIGPYDPIPFERTASFKQIFFNGAPKSKQVAYRRQILERLANHAYRRPATKAELARLTAIAELVHQHGGNFYKQVQISLEALLMSPDFLFRVEKDPHDSTTHRVNDYELASRLSYFLWSSMPDDELLAAASKGRLHETNTLHAEVKRMLASPKASALAQNFSGQWLQTQNLDFETPDAKTFPQYDLQLRDAMQAETRMFFASVMSEDRSVLDFLSAKYSFMDERLANFYGIKGVAGASFRRVSLEGTERGGILTQASVLTATSYPTRTSPTVRGKWILANILNTPPPDPPANVPSLATAAENGKAKSIHERLGMHRANPVCASCHAGMDPLGFALEHYNAIGQYRQVDDGFPVDATGTLPDGTTLDGASQLQVLLLKQSSKFVNCLSEKLLTYGLGRGLVKADRPAVRRIERTVDRDGYKFSSLIYAIVDSAPFQMRKSQTRTSVSQQIASTRSTISFPESNTGGKP